MSCSRGNQQSLRQLTLGDRTCAADAEPLDQVLRCESMFFRESGSEQNIQTWPARFGLAGQLNAAHAAKHNDIGEKQTDIAVCLGSRQRFAGIVRKQPLAKGSLSLSSA